MIMYILGALILSAVCGFVITPVILDFCKHKNLYDIPNARKVHKTLVPRLGGISFFPSMTITFIVMLFYTHAQEPRIQINIGSAGFLLGAVILYIIGIIDDLVGLKPKTKFIAQIVSATLLPLGGLYINNLYGLFGINEIPFFIGVPLTVFCIVFIDNAINMIDGIDGLASGLSLLAFMGFLSYFIYYNVFIFSYCILIAGLIGTLIAFMYFNIFGKTEKNNKLFMGDSGSLTLGFWLGFLSIKCAMDDTAIWPYRPEAIIVPISLLFVPAADMVRVSFCRLFNHLPLCKADKNHIHHKLMQAGMTQHQALGAILGLALLIDVTNYCLFSKIGGTWTLMIDIAIYVFTYSLLRFYQKSRQAV